MAAKKAARKRSSSDRGLKSSHSRRRAKADRPTKRSAESVEAAVQETELKRLIPEQPIDGSDTEQALGHGNQRALMTRAQQQVGQSSGLEPLVEGDPSTIRARMMSAGWSNLTESLNTALSDYEMLCNTALATHLQKVRDSFGGQL